MGELLTLHSPGWERVLLAGLSQLWQKEVLCDVTIKCMGDTVIQAHAMVLAASSPFFCDIFQTTGKLTEINLGSFERQIIMYILEFVYHGTVHVPEGAMSALKDAASGLNFQVLLSVLRTQLEKGTGKRKLPEKAISKRKFQVMSPKVEKNQIPRKTPGRKCKSGADTNEETPRVMGDSSPPCSKRKIPAINEVPGSPSNLKQVAPQIRQSPRIRQRKKPDIIRNVKRVKTSSKRRSMNSSEQMDTSPIRPAATVETPILWQVDTEGSAVTRNSVGMVRVQEEDEEEEEDLFSVKEEPDWHQSAEQEEDFAPDRHQYQLQQESANPEDDVDADQCQDGRVLADVEQSVDPDQGSGRTESPEVAEDMNPNEDHVQKESVHHEDDADVETAQEDGPAEDRDDGDDGDDGDNNDHYAADDDVGDDFADNDVVGDDHVSNEVASIPVEIHMNQTPDAAAAKIANYRADKTTDSKENLLAKPEVYSMAPESDDHLYAFQVSEQADPQRAAEVAPPDDTGALLDGFNAIFDGNNSELLRQGETYLEISDGQGGIQYIQVNPARTDSDAQGGEVGPSMEDGDACGIAPVMDVAMLQAAQQDGSSDEICSVAQQDGPSVAVLLPAPKCQREKKHATAPRHQGPSFQCSQCSYCYASAELLQSHLARMHRMYQHLAKPRRFQCDSCNYSTEYKTLLDDHTRIHTGEKPFVCPNCGKAFRTKGSLSDHMKRESGVKAYACTHCPKAFATKIGRSRHVNGVHIKQRNYVCPYESCGKMYPSSYVLNQHVKHHTGVKDVKCTYCTKSFYTRHMLKLHVHSKHVDDPSRRYPCDVCGKVYRIRESALLHKRYRHDARFIAEREIRRIERNAEKARVQATLEPKPQKEKPVRTKKKSSKQKQAEESRGGEAKNTSPWRSKKEDGGLARPRKSRSKKRIIAQLVTDGEKPEVSNKEEGETSSDDDVSYGSVSWHSDESEFFSDEDDVNGEKDTKDNGAGSPKVKAQDLARKDGANVSRPVAQEK